MSSKEKKLSSYIDSLNDERKPSEHGSKIDETEMEDLLETIRMVRSLKEPTLPEGNFAESLAANVNKKLQKEKHTKTPRKKWFYGVASAAAIALIVALNTLGPFSKNNMVYAMEQAFKGVKAYHGVLEVIETNAEGKSVTQSKVEVWADKEGHYYVKGLEGMQKDLITANNGQKKWQVQPQEKEVDVFAAFPDVYSFTFEIGKEIEDVKNAIKTRNIGDDTVSGRAASIIEVTPQGGNPYKIWIDKETKMPLQKQSAMEYSLQYKVRYDNIDFTESVPKELLAYNVPNGFKEINTNTDQVVNSLEEAKAVVGFVPKVPENISESYAQSGIAVVNSTKAVKINYISSNNKKVSILQKKASGEFKPASMSVLGKINNNQAEVQSPIQSEAGVLQGGGAYAGAAGISSVRWQQNGFEYAVVGNTSLEELTAFIKGLTNGTVDLIIADKQLVDKPQIQVSVDLKAEEGDQKNVDAGHSPWKLDPVFVSQVFVSLKISPEGIEGDYPVKYEELKLVENTGKEAVVEVSGSKTPIRKIYLKKLVRQDNTGVWTVVGYDPIK